MGRAVAMLSTRYLLVVDLDQRTRHAWIASCGDSFRENYEPQIMEIVYFTLTAIALYVISDMALRRMEAFAGRRFEHRTLIFFAIILGLALVSFALIRNFGGV